MWWIINSVKSFEKEKKTFSSLTQYEELRSSAFIPLVRLNNVINFCILKFDGEMTLRLMIC